MVKAGLVVIALASAAAGAPPPHEAELDFMSECVSTLQKDGRPRETADAACSCIARRTTDRPDLRDEFLLQIAAPRQSPRKSSPDLRQVRAACVPMPILVQGEAG